MVSVSGCCGNQGGSSPIHLSPELEYKPFPSGILGSDGESDPFESLSSPETVDNGELMNIH